MPLNEDIAFVGQLIDTYAIGEDLCGVAANSPTSSGVPAAMQAGPIDKDGWVKWRVLPSTLTESEITALENKFNLQFPPLFRAYLLARFHMFDQVNSPRHDQMFILPDTPAGRPLKPISDVLTLWHPLVDAGYIPFADWGDGWGPMSFDSTRRASDGDCPIVWMDHEILVPLGKDKWRLRQKVESLAQPLYNSFRDLLIDVFGRS